MGVGVGIVGLGNVGLGTLEVLSENGKSIREKLGLSADGEGRMQP